MLKQTVTDQIDLLRDGSVCPRFKKIVIMDDGRVVWGYHRTSIKPTDDAEATLAHVTAHLTAMKCGTLSQGEWARILRTTLRVHTKEAVAAYVDRLARLKAGENPDDDLDGETVFKQTSVLFKTPADDADKVDGVILARAVQIIVGFEPQPIALDFRLFPGEDFTQRKANFEAQVAVVKAEAWTGVADMAAAEHTPEVVAKFVEYLEAKAEAVRRIEAERAEADAPQREGSMG